MSWPSSIPWCSAKCSSHRKRNKNIGSLIHWFIDSSNCRFSIADFRFSIAAPGLMVSARTIVNRQSKIKRRQLPAHMEQHIGSPSEKEDQADIAVYRKERGVEARQIRGSN